MQPTLQLITATLTRLEQPITGHRLSQAHDIKDIYYQNDKLIVHFTFPHVKSASFRTFQRIVLKTLKQDLRIHHVQLNYAQAPHTTQEEASPVKKLFPAATCIVLTSNETSKDTIKSAIQRAHDFSQKGHLVALIDFALTSNYILKQVKLEQQKQEHTVQKIQPFMLNDEIALMSTYLLNPHNRPLAWRDEMMERLTTQYIFDVAWHQTTSIFLFHLPQKLNHLLPTLMMLIPEIKVEVIADERS
jgi:hypothetical protein